MLKFFANYTVSGGFVNINCITTIGNDGLLTSVEQFDGELAYTRYVTGVLVIVPVGCEYAILQSKFGDLQDVINATMAFPNVMSMVGSCVRLIEVDTFTDNNIYLF